MLREEERVGFELQQASCNSKWNKIRLFLRRPQNLLTFNVFRASNRWLIEAQHKDGSIEEISYWIADPFRSAIRILGIKFGFSRLANRWNRGYLPCFVLGFYNNSRSVSNFEILFPLVKEGMGVDKANLHVLVDTWLSLQDTPACSTIVPGSVSKYSWKLGAWKKRIIQY